jgi:hypothetical protein
MLDGSIEGMGPARPPFMANLCGELTSHEALDEDDWTAPMPPPAVAKLLERYQAETMLVPAVSNEWRCLSEGPHATSCHETKLTLVAYLFTADRVIWKARYRLGLGNETPDLASGVRELLAGLPLGKVARLQDPEAPTYERALEEAGVLP